MAVEPVASTPPAPIPPAEGMPPQALADEFSLRLVTEGNGEPANTPGQPNDYRMATDNETWDPPEDIEIVDVPEGAEGEDLVAFKANGQTVVVDKTVNPGLYDYIQKRSQVDQLWLDSLKKNPEIKALLPNQSLSLDGITEHDIIVAHASADDGRAWVRAPDGTEYFVFPEFHPELYGKLRAIGRDGYERPPSDINNVKLKEVGAPGDYADGLIGITTEDGKKYIVDKTDNPALYAQAVDKYQTDNIEKVNNIREEFGLPPLSDLDLMSMPTGEKSDPDKADSPILNVGEYAITKLLDDYRKGVEDGTYAKDSVQAKLVRAFEAKAALASGRDITPYLEAINPFGGTMRQFGEEPVHLTDEDMNDIIDGDAVDRAITDLLGDETIRGDYEKKLKEGIEKIPEDKRNQLETDLVSALESEDYVKYLAELDKQGLSHMASLDTNTMLSSLSLLDPEKAEKVAQKLMMNTITHQLNNIDYSKVSEENKDLALKDTLYHLVGLFKSGGNIARMGVHTFEKFLAETIGDKTKLTNLRKLLEEAFPNGIVDPNYDRAMSAIDRSIDKFIPSADKPAVYQFLSKMASTGFLGSMAGGISLLQGIYQIVGKGGALAQTPQQRLGIANSFISFLSMGSHFATLGDKMLNLIGVSGFADFMGLSKSLPQVWGKEGLYNLETKSPFTSAVRDDVSSAAAKINDVTEMRTIPSNLNDQYDGIAQLFSDEAGARGITDIPPSMASKIASSALKVMGAVTDFAGGVLDIVLGAFTIKSGIKSGDGLEQAGGALQVIAGTMGLGAGAIGIAGLFGSIGVASTLIGPLFLVGAVLGGIGAIISIFVDHNKQQAATDKEGKWFIDAAGDGLLHSDWGDKVEYARYATYWYGDRDTPEDQSMFVFQKSEWEHFRDTPPKDGSSKDRLDNTKHIDYDKDNKNMPGHEYDDIYPMGGGV